MGSSHSAEILVRWRDGVNVATGDIVAIWPAPGPWGKAELEGDQWRIFRVLGIPEKEVLDLTTRSVNVSRFGLPSRKGVDLIVEWSDLKGVLRDR